MSREIETIVVTGGAGFIGSALIRLLLKKQNYKVVNIDNLTYASNNLDLLGFDKYDNYSLIESDICNYEKISEVFALYNPSKIINLAAETHVDRSIDNPDNFIRTNILGTYNLLKVSLDHWRSLSDRSKEAFRFHHVSTDEVYGSLGSTGKFTEQTRYSPNSPYSASKASSDHLVKAWYHTFGLPVTISNTSNNYGPFQFPEKLIPLFIYRAIEGKDLPIYGDGRNVRDWIFVDDHASAILDILIKGRVGETYNIGGDCELENISVVRKICKILDSLLPSQSGKSYGSQIVFVQDRPGHDFRYSIDSTKIKTELGWKQETPFVSGLNTTIRWYLENKDLVKKHMSNRYGGKRLGLK